MSIRITDAKTELLIREFADLHELTPSQAVRMAVSKLLVRESTDRLDGSAIEKVVIRRVVIAAIEGADEQVARVWDELSVPSVILVLFLTLIIFFPDARFGIVGLVIIVSLISVYLYGRGLKKARQERSSIVESLKKDIDELATKIPSELEFLLTGPSHDDSIKSPPRPQFCGDDWSTD
jgi:hypothetical protein